MKIKTHNKKQNLRKILIYFDKEINLLIWKKKKSKIKNRNKYSQGVKVADFKCSKASRPLLYVYAVFSNYSANPKPGKSVKEIIKNNCKLTLTTGK
jgi:hypothetical protein